MIKLWVLRLLVIAPGIIAGFLLLGTTLVYAFSLINTQYQIDGDDLPFGIGHILVALFILTKLIGESFGALLSLEGNLFTISWVALKWLQKGCS